VVVRVVERRRQAIGFGDDGRRARPRELGHDVDALPGAREEDCRHAREGSPPVGAGAAPSGGCAPDEVCELAADALELAPVLEQLGLARTPLLEDPAHAKQAFESEDQPVELGIEEKVGGAHHGLLSFVPAVMSIDRSMAAPSESGMSVA
jgi:hypothetical protein